MNHEEAQAEARRLTGCDTLVCVERSCVAVPGSFVCTGGHVRCPKGVPYCAIEDAAGKQVARGRSWAEAFCALGHCQGGGSCRPYPQPASHFVGGRGYCHDHYREAETRARAKP